MAKAGGEVEEGENEGRARAERDQLGKELEALKADLEIYAR